MNTEYNSQINGFICGKVHTYSHIDYLFFIQLEIISKYDMQNKELRKLEKQ